MIIINEKHIKAEDGYVLIRTVDGANFGFEAILGKRMQDGILVQDTPADFHEEQYEPDQEEKSESGKTSKKSKASGK